MVTNLRRHFGGKNRQEKSNLELNGGVDSEVRADRQWEEHTQIHTSQITFRKNTITGLAPSDEKIRFEGSYCEMQTLGGIASNCI